jgi:PAS domain S-box-containing protein
MTSSTEPPPHLPPDLTSTPALDTIVHLAARTLDVPHALVTLRADDRVLVCASTGTPAFAQPLEHALDAVPLETGQIAVLDTPNTNPRFAGNDFVQEQPIRFYAGVPLFPPGAPGRPDASPVGTLSVMDTAERSLTAEQVATLRDLADLAAPELPPAPPFAPSVNHEPEDTKRLQMLEQVVENALESIVVTEAEPLDEPGPRILYVNRAFEEMTGYEKEEVVGRSPRFLQGPETDRRVLDHVRMQLEDGEPVTDETVNYRKDGTPFRIQWTIAPVTGPGGDVQYWVALQRDVTDQRATEEALREERNLLRGITETSIAAITVADAHTGQLTFANDRAEDILGLEPSDIVDRTYNDPEWNITDLDGEPFPDEKLPFRQVIETGEPVFGVEHAIEWPDGRRRALRINGAPLRDEAGIITRVVFAIEDVTEQVQYEAKLVEAKERAEEMNALKTSFLANMSHEIRTPLTSIIGFAEIIGNDPAAAGQFADVIRTSGERLLHTLDAVLDLAQLEADVFEHHPEPIDVLALTRDVAAEYRERLRGDDVDFSFRVEVTGPSSDFSASPAPSSPSSPASGDRSSVQIQADERAVRRILSSVLDNAVKFTDTGRIEVVFDAGPDAVRLRVVDTGVGISEDFLPDVFDEFKQESTGDTRTFEGSGLGLTIAKQLTDLAGGRIGIRSTKGEGTTVRIEFPR